MLHLRLYGASAVLHEIGEDLDRSGAARSVTLAVALPPDHVLLTAEIRPEHADSVLQHVAGSGVPHEDVALVRFDDVGPIRLRGRGSRLIWADVVGQATRNARPVARYLVFMVAAGVIAAFGVVEVNTILIVGAMAVSPDLLPVAPPRGLGELMTPSSAAGLAARADRLWEHRGVRRLTAGLLPIHEYQPPLRLVRAGPGPPCPWPGASRGDRTEGSGDTCPAARGGGRRADGPRDDVVGPDERLPRAAAGGRPVLELHDRRPADDRALLVDPSSRQPVRAPARGARVPHVDRLVAGGELAACVRHRRTGRSPVLAPHPLPVPRVPDGPGGAPGCALDDGRPGDRRTGDVRSVGALVAGDRRRRAADQLCAQLPGERPAGRLLLVVRPDGRRRRDLHLVDARGRRLRGLPRAAAGGVAAPAPGAHGGRRHVAVVSPGVLRLQLLRLDPEARATDTRCAGVGHRRHSRPAAVGFPGRPAAGRAVRSRRPARAAHPACGTPDPCALARRDRGRAGRPGAAAGLLGSGHARVPRAVRRHAVSGSDRCAPGVGNGGGGWGGGGGGGGGGG